MTDTPFHIDRRGPVFEFTLNRPKANAIDAQTSKAMGDAFAEFRDDPDMRVAIITGAGEKFFCPGWDLKSAAEGEEPDSDYGVGGFGGLQELPDLNKPVIAAVNGICCGGGLEWALSADMILAAHHASFALPEIRSGTIADAATAKLPKRMPFHIAMELLLTGRWLDAEEAHRWGLVNEIVPAAGLMDRARELADLLASGPPLVYAAIKEVARAAETLSFQETMDGMNNRTFATIATLYSSEDQLEGARAFAEKRDPVWKGR
ncbi:MAG: carnitinyl-CoA dehydratase [Hyphomicrobiaceae bacterium]